MKIQRTRRSATPRSPRRRAGSVAALVVIVVVIEEAGASLLAVMRRHDGDLLSPGVHLEAGDAVDEHAHRHGQHVLLVVAVPFAAPLGLDAFVEKVLELEAPEVFEEDGGVQARLVDRLAAECSAREERALAHHQTRRIVHHLVDDAREAPPAFEAGAGDERQRARRPHEEDILLVVAVARLVGDDRLDLADEDVGRHPQALRRDHRHLPPLHRPDAQIEGAVADHGDERERRERDDDLEEGEAGTGDGGREGAPAAPGPRSTSALSLRPSSRPAWRTRTWVRKPSALSRSSLWSWISGVAISASMAARAASTARVSRLARCCMRRLAPKIWRQVTTPTPRIASATATSMSVKPTVPGARPVLGRSAACALPMPPDPVGLLDRSRARPPSLPGAGPGRGPSSRRFMGWRLPRGSYRGADRALRSGGALCDRAGP